MKYEKIRIMIIEDEKFDVKRIRKTLGPFEKDVEVVQIVSEGKDALETLKKNGQIDVIVMDYQISGGLFGESLIREIKSIDPTVQVMVITKMTLNQTDIYFANQLLNSGAYWFGTKYPADIEDYIYQPTDFILTIRNAKEKRILEKKNLASQKKLEENIQNVLKRRPLLGNSAPIRDLRRNIEKFASSDANVLITGESGTGKELIAMNLHYRSDRRYESFITVNCAAIPKDLIESELFGFVKGSFTGARESKIGLFEQADKGTIFLDEICELPVSMQAKLLRVLETGELEKIGRRKKHEVNVRVISATNQDIKKMVAEKTFREDLYYRLNILHLYSIPVREIPEDIPGLIDYHLNYFAKDRSVIPPAITSSAMNVFKSFNWPGNVRQIKNFVQRILLKNTNKINASQAAEIIGVKEGERITVETMSIAEKIDDLTLKTVETEFRKKFILMVRNRSKSDADAARKLGIAPPNYYRMCKDLGLKQ